MPTSSAIDPARQKPVAIWLFAVAALVAIMVLVGGATRLTESGLSITEWAPVTGAIPPLSDAAWAAEFEKYKQIPEYELVNEGMSLAEFQFIYWWEWGHRFLGRVIGLAFAVPLIVFLLTKRVGGRDLPGLLGLFVLGGLQGAVGWWMVASGLVDRVDVSQHRLAAHLGLATLIFGALIWAGLGYARRSGLLAAPNGAGPAFAAPVSLALAAAVFGQIVLGAFVAGLRAGKGYNTWPLMDGYVVPTDYALGAAMFETIGGVQFNHRLGAYLVVAGALATAAAVWRTTKDLTARRLSGAIAAIALAQTALGVWTVLNAAPIGLGLAHQAGALALFAVAVAFAETARERRQVDSRGRGVVPAAEPARI